MEDELASMGFEVKGRRLGVGRDFLRDSVHPHEASRSRLAHFGKEHSPVTTNSGSPTGRLPDWLDMHDLRKPLSCVLLTVCISLCILN